jgi:putative transposase
MIAPDHRVSIKRQAELIDISRGTAYYVSSKTTSDADQALMKLIDRLHLDYPFAGARMLRDMLNRDGHEIGRKHVATLMRKMGIQALYRKPNTSKRHPQHTIYPYRLRGLRIERANHVWAMDITYVPMARGWVYLAAVVDWASRRVLAHRVSISMDTSFCVEALEEAFAKHGRPEIFNTDQGSQFTSTEFIHALSERQVAISMDGRGCWRDNVFVERLWRTIKYEHVYLHAYDSVSDARAQIARFIEFYNTLRPHSSLDKKTPDEFYFATLPAIQRAA